jgi:hypothetical protein
MANVEMHRAPIVSVYLNRDRRFYVTMATALLAVTFLGFAPTYYLKNFTHAPDLGPLVHIHGVVFSAWMLLFCAQTGFISARRPDLHKITGVFGCILAVAILVIGVLTAIESARAGHGPPDRNQPVFLIFPLTLMLLFGCFTTFAIVNRTRSEYHKRLMLLATIALATTPLARIGKMLGFPFQQPAIGGIILADFFLIALIIFDMKKFGRLHPVTLWAGATLFVSGPLRIFLGQTETWQDFARYIIG